MNGVINGKVEKIIPSYFAESMYLLDGKPFRLTNRYYLRTIYDTEAEETIIMSGRQVEKSTTNAVHIANNTLLIPNFKCLYAAPLMKQVRVFSRERLGRLYRYSNHDMIKKNFMSKDMADNVGHKEFTNGSVNYLEHCFELGDNIRGISANGVYIDEVQDIHIDAIPVIRESQSHAYESGAGIKITQYTGTPKTFSNTIQQTWEKSTQNEWVVKCPHCGTHQILGMKNLTPDKYICRKCRMEIGVENIINGMWIPTQPGKYMQGYRISQMMVPWIKPFDLWQKAHMYSIGKFHNECLGRSFESADKPFTMSVLGRISDNDQKLLTRREGVFANRQTFMGVDWGTGERSYTVITIFSINGTGQLQLIYVKRFEHGDELEQTYQVEFICALMQQFQVAYCIVDWGFGVVQFEMLRKKFGSRVDCCYYSFNLSTKNKYDKRRSRWTVNRSQVMTDYVNYVKEARVLWPGMDKGQFPWLYDHHLNEYAEYRESPKTGRTEDLIYNHPEGAPDDGLHSCVYAYLASILYKGSPINTIRFAGAVGERL
jgi:hypothetical protein